MKLPKLLKTKRGDISKFPHWYREVLRESPGNLPADDVILEVKTYHTKDVIHAFENIFEWRMTLAKMDDEREAKRIKTIMELIRSGKPAWPYVSYWVDNLRELFTVEKEPNGEISVPNHGDGWHRLIAANELKRKTVDILFIR